MTGAPSKDRRVEISIKDSNMTMGEVIAYMLIHNKMDRDREYFMDGDAYAIVSEVRP